jgi:hypothetical protein
MVFGKNLSSSATSQQQCFGKVLQKSENRWGLERSSYPFMMLAYKKQCGQGVKSFDFKQLLNMKKLAYFNLEDKVVFQEGVHC